MKNFTKIRENVFPLIISKLFLEKLKNLRKFPWECFKQPKIFLFKLDKKFQMICRENSDISQTHHQKKISKSTKIKSLVINQVFIRSFKFVFQSYDSKSRCRFIKYEIRSFVANVLSYSWYTEVRIGKSENSERGYEAEVKWEVKLEKLASSDR